MSKFLVPCKIATSRNGLNSHHHISISGTRATTAESQDLQLNLPIQDWTTNMTEESGSISLTIGGYEATGVAHNGMVFVSGSPGDDVRWFFKQRDGYNGYTIVPANNPNVGWTVVNEHNLDPFIAVREFSDDFDGQLFLFETYL